MMGKAQTTSTPPGTPRGPRFRGLAAAALVLLSVVMGLAEGYRVSAFAGP